MRPESSGAEGLTVRCYRSEACLSGLPRLPKVSLEYSWIGSNADSASGERDAAFPKHVPDSFLWGPRLPFLLFWPQPRPALTSPVSTHLPTHLLSLTLGLGWRMTSSSHLLLFTLGLGATMPLTAKKPSINVHTLSWAGRGQKPVPVCPMPHAFLLHTS